SLSPKAEERLCKALDINRPLATAYYLKESLRRVWRQDNKQDAAIVLADWIDQARQSGLRPIESIADTLSRHSDGILAWYDYRISNGKLEGINNKIKTMKRQAYGYRDMLFFKLKLLSLHDSTYPFSG
ncbi:MAG: transposase, partial [Bacteroidales bacterium]|nr:transposase [Bacteroidales bacterium]